MRPPHRADNVPRPVEERVGRGRLEDPDGRQLLVKRAGGSWSVGYSGPGTGTIEEIAGLADNEVLDRIRSTRKD